MKVKGKEHAEYKTARQWALDGYLPADNVKGIQLRPNHFSKDGCTYFSPSEVEKASPEQLSAFFAPERERRNRNARKRRQERREELAETQRMQKEQEQEELIGRAVRPYLNKIRELHNMIRDISTANAPETVNGGCIVIDTETTGLNPQTCEILQISIIDLDGNTLFNSYFRPCAESWEEAERVNGISPQMVQDAPVILEKMDEVNRILQSADTIIGYNTFFDLEFLHNNGMVPAKNAKIIDVMELFAPIYGEYNEYYGTYKWQKLTTAALYCGYDWTKLPTGAHDSLADCHATLFVYNCIKPGGPMAPTEDKE